ncbi:MAG: flagellar filament capping protein FliD [Sedimentibacter sp.]
MSILSTSIYGSTTSKGYGGLVSGLDTDDLVTQMLAGTKSKINKNYQAQQKLVYRQDAYREISTKLLSFSDKYFSYSSGSNTNVLSSKFFESYTYEPSSSYVNITGKADNIENFSIDSIVSVASSANFASSKKVTSGAFESEEIAANTSTLAGATMTIEYNSQSYNLTIDKGFGNGDDAVTIDEVVTQLNKQLATISGNEDNSGLKYKVDASNQIVFETGSAKLTAASTAILDNLSMKVGDDAVSASAIDSANLTKDAISVLQDEASYITFDFNGVQKKISLDSTITDSTTLKNYLNEELGKAYGAGKIVVDLIDEDGNGINQLKFSATGDTNILGISSISKDLSNLTGIEMGDYNRVNKTRTIAQSGIEGIGDVATTTLSSGEEGYIININDVDIEIESTMTVADIISKINSNTEAGVSVYYSSTTDSFTVKATETGSHKGVTIASGDNTLAKAIFGTAGVDYSVNLGTDTEMTYTLNGVQNTVVRSTASFTIDEMNIELNKKAAGLETTDTPITFNVTNNADEIVEKFKEFIDSYNEIISLISTKTSEKPDSDYAPLTPDQEDEMETDEIQEWEAQARLGILFGDSKMNSVLSNMREAMSSITSGSSLTLSSIGVASASYDTSGKLVLDEAKFKEKLLENPDEIANLFSYSASDASSASKSGLAVQLKAILLANVGTHGTTGYLIDEAGIDGGLTSDQNYISTRIDEYDDKMEELRDDMEDERERYWSKFTAMETALSTLNTQSSWFTDMLG